MFFIGQNLKHDYMTYPFLERFILVDISDIYCLEFISHRIKEMLYQSNLQRKQIMK